MAGEGLVALAKVAGIDLEKVRAKAERRSRALDREPVYRDIESTVGKIIPAITIDDEKYNFTLRAGRAGKTRVEVKGSDIVATLSRKKTNACIVQSYRRPGIFWITGGCLYYRFGKDYTLHENERLAGVVLEQLALGVNLIKHGSDEPVGYKFQKIMKHALDGFQIKLSKELLVVLKNHDYYSEEMLDRAKD